MESDELGAADAVRIAERAEAAPFTELPHRPWWYIAAHGLWAAVFAAHTTLQLSGDDGLLSGWAGPAISLFMLALVLWLARSYGAEPRLRHAPPEFRRVLRAYLVGVIGLIAVVALAGRLGGPWPAAAVAGVGWSATAFLVQRGYDGAARRVRARLS